MVHPGRGFPGDNNKLPGLSGEEKTFWSRFQLAPDAVIFYAESHKDIIHPVVLEGVGRVLNFDAHHDAGYHRPKNEKVSCENWIQHLPRGTAAEVIYPYWKFYAKRVERTPLKRVPRIIDDRKPCETVIDRIFLCRSGAWVPGWLDDEFDTFLQSCPAGSKIQVAPLVERKWDDKPARKMRATFDEMIAEMNAKGIGPFKEQISISVEAVK